MIRGISSKRFHGSSYIGVKDSLAKSVRRPHLRQYSPLYRPTSQKTYTTPPWLCPYENEQDYHRGLYNSNSPREYHPNLNAPAVQSDKYVADTNWESHHIPHADEPQFCPPFPDTDPVEQPITYEQSKTMSEFFLKDMEDQYQPLEDGQEISSLAGIRSMNGHSNLEDVAGGLVQQREGFAGNEPDIVSSSATARTLGAMPELDGHDTGIMPDEINQAIDGVTDERMVQEMELDPFQMQYDPYMAAHRIFDQQMQYMANPLLMPGLMGPIPGPMLGF